jgi:2-oxoglutarate ferredoxin oxidoreductase subunit gamma
MKRDVRIAGRGGQGILLTGVILGMAATIYDEKMATQMQSYGPEARGGASKTDVIISDDPINYPFILMADVFVALSAPAYQKYRREVKKDGVTYVDPQMVPSYSTKCIEIPAMSMALELGAEIVTNMVMLGAVTTHASLVTYESLSKAISATVAPDYTDLNLRAIEKGRDYVQHHLMEEKKNV